MEKIDLFSSDLPRKSYLFKNIVQKSIKKVNGIPVKDSEISVSKEKPVGDSAIIRTIYVKEMENLRNYIQEIMINNSNLKLFVDMDGVLVDFEKGYKEYVGKDVREVDPFWEPIKDNSDFWINLEWMRDGKKLWNFVKRFNPTILSSPLQDNGSKEGKKVWVRENLGTDIPVILETNKQIYAGPNSILIDDLNKNIKNWQAHSGIGVLHTDADSTIKRLKNIF